MDYILSFFRPPSSPFAPPPLLYHTLHHPLTTFITFLHYLLLYLRGPAYKAPKPSSNRQPIRVVCISDTHTKIPRQRLPPGDLLIHAGDLTNSGTRSEIQRSLDWLKTLAKVWPGSSDGYRYIVAIAGNHDSYFDERSRSTHDKRMKHQKLDWGRKITYLQHSSVKLEFPDGRKLNVYGAPQIPKCGGKEFAFQYERGQDAWSETVPDEVDILVTHNPPKWHLDVSEGGGQGDEFELKECWRVKPTLHVFGHVHSGHGKESVWWDEGQRGWERLKEYVYGREKVGSYENEPFVGTELLDVKLWVMGAKVLWQDLKGLLWNRLWGGTRQGGFMVNAALTYQTTNKLGHKAQVVSL